LTGLWVESTLNHILNMGCLMAVTPWGNCFKANVKDRDCELENLFQAHSMKGNPR
jgi:hypothetical protein